ncbi:MAG: type II toxin-antitoxin system RelE/ParE family toxin [Planctomycetota bacterium]
MYPFVYISNAGVCALPDFLRWLDGLRDARTQARIHLRLRRLGKGHAGDCKMIEPGLHELRLHFGPGYRVYYTQSGGVAKVLVGGDKWSQLRDIATARALLRQMENAT